MQRERKEEERETMTSDYRKFLLDLISSASHFNKNEAAASATSLSKQKYLSKFQNFSSKNSSFGSIFGADFSGHIRSLWARRRTLTVGGRITVLLVSSLTRLDLTNEKICCYSYVVKQLNPYL